MVFGIGAGLTFAYIPIIKVSGLPLIGYRMPPRFIIRVLTWRLGIKMAYQTFRSPELGMAALDQHLSQGTVVGLQTSVFWLSYFPPRMRFHFNAHNLIVHGKRDEQYLISDPVIDVPVQCPADSLSKARFVRGPMAPKGLLYYPVSVPDQLDLAGAIRKSVRFTTGMMLHAPLFFIGVRGIRWLGRVVRRLGKQDPRYARLVIGHVVRMQEEIGTGGAGFRFLYASFLQEAAQLCGNDELHAIASQLTDAGDRWRGFALDAAKMVKDRAELDLNLLADELLELAELEAAVYRRLRAQVK
jgi:hypothetical protein